MSQKAFRSNYIRFLSQERRKIHCLGGCGIFLRKWW